MRALRERVDRVVEGAVFLLLAAMVINVTWQVFTRFVLRSPSPWTEELARFLLIWSGLLGACVAWRRNLHLAIRLFARDSAEPPPWARTVTLAATAGFALSVLGVGGLRLVTLTLQLEQRSAALGWALGWVYLAVPISGAILLFYIVAEWRLREEHS